MLTCATETLLEDSEFTAAGSFAWEGKLEDLSSIKGSDPGRLIRQVSCVKGHPFSERERTSGKISWMRKTMKRFRTWSVEENCRDVLARRIDIMRAGDPGLTGACGSRDFREAWHKLEPWMRLLEKWGEAMDEWQRLTGPDRRLEKMQIANETMAVVRGGEIINLPMRGLEAPLSGDVLWRLEQSAGLPADIGQP